MRWSAWHGLGLFWLAIAGIIGGGAITLQVLGPPAPAHNDAPASSAVPAPLAEASPPHADPAPAAPPAPSAVADPSVAGPDPALLERSRGFPQLMLPKVAADGRAARTAYAAPVPPASHLPRIALLLAGVGQSTRDSGTASEMLPGPVGFAVSTYAGNPALLIEAARARGHELFASIPMEPQGYPLNDEGTRSLRTGLTPEENQTNLEWALGQVQGAVGATGASDGMRGERFAELSAAFDPVLDEIGRRGLLYLDPRPGRPAARPGTRAVDLVLDEPPARAEIEAKLASLERMARDKGSAIGLIGPPRPVTLERIASWARGLQARGILLVPVSSLIETAHE